ncbi:MAG: segregation and condensation protein A [Phycisphaerales bacterium JB040]
MTQTYRVQLDSFEGPMDLLLYLIRKAEVDIEDIPIAAVTEQYLEYVEHIDRIDIELAGEFLVMAATLMEIKSRMIRPPEEGEGEPDAREREDDAPGEDPRAELVRQLLEYKKHRDAADALEERRLDWARRYPAAPAGGDRDAVDQAADELAEQAAAMELDELDLLQLMEAYKSIVSSVNFERLGDHEILSDDTPIELHAEDIVERLTSRAREAGGSAGARPLPLAELLEGRTRPHMVGLFLALLTLVRDQRVKVATVDGQVAIDLRDDSTTSDNTSAGRDEPSSPSGE